VTTPLEVRLRAVEVTSTARGAREFRLYRDDDHYTTGHTEASLAALGIEVPERTFRVTVELTEEELLNRADAIRLADLPDPSVPESCIGKLNDAARAVLSELKGL
jgi:hypothetical protein